MASGLTGRGLAGLSALIAERIGDGFLTDLSRLEGLKQHMDDATVQAFRRVKRLKKEQLCAEIAKREGVTVSPDMMFDVQIKRLHEYKRQLLNALSIYAIYKELRAGRLKDFAPTVYIFGAKAAPGYVRAKSVIYYINQLAELVNSDPRTRDRLKIVFVRNYNCSWAEKIIPAADVSEQISPAGTEASGTGNMKLMLNGAVTLGTYDGANIEIFEQAGIENNYVFGATVEEINAIKATYDPNALYEADAHLRRVVDALGDGTFEPADAPMEEGQLVELKKALLEGASWHQPDHYFLLKDYASYMEAKLKAIRDTRDELDFAKKCLHNIAGAGKFSSDRTIEEYWRELWG